MGVATALPLAPLRTQAQLRREAVAQRKRAQAAEADKQKAQRLAQQRGLDIQVRADRQAACG